MKLFTFILLVLAGAVLLWNAGSPLWLAAFGALAWFLAGWVLRSGLWPPLGRFDLRLQSPEKTVQLGALADLGAILESEYEDPLQYLRGILLRTQRDEDKEVRDAASKLLARLDHASPPPEHPYEPVGPQIEEEGIGEVPIEKRVEWIRETFSGTVAVPHLLEVLRSDDPEVCRDAVDVLVEIGEPALPALEQALEDPDPDVHVDVERAIRLIRGEPPTE